jgi:predicted house-cleaning noncanonical NTP pyrophosphatase (MazG superfamily)
MPVRYDKLVRDRIPEIIQAQGQHPVTRILDNASYQEALLAKLAEETREAQEAAAGDLPDELADIVEVIQALATAVGMSWVQLLALAADKRTRRGGFEGGSSSKPWSWRTNRRRALQTERPGGASQSRLKAPYLARPMAADHRRSWLMPAGAFHSRGR